MRFSLSTAHADFGLPTGGLFIRRRSTTPECHRYRPAGWPRKGKTLLLTCVCVLSFSLVVAGRSNAALSFWSELSENTDAQLQVVTFGTHLEPGNEILNPDNRLLKLPRYTLETSLRPDLGVDMESWRLRVKPRAQLTYFARDEEVDPEGTEFEDDYYVNEWQIQIKPTEGFIAIGGRENLQWGPAFLFSPSNPFIGNNGNANPFVEVPGMDFARLVFLPDDTWTYSLIASVDKGRQTFENQDFSSAIALKMDYAGIAGNWGMIMACNQERHFTFGMFGNWSATDALMLYADAAMIRGSFARYPEPTEDNPTGFQLRAQAVEQTYWTPSCIIGGAYTFLSGPTISLEYLYNGLGYDSRQAQDLADYRLEASAIFTSDGPYSEAGAALLGQSVDVGLEFLRRSYLMLQWYHHGIAEVLDVRVRGLGNLDDGALRCSLQVEYAFAGNARAFLLGVANSGSADSEFRTLYDEYVLLGFELFF